MRAPRAPHPRWARSLAFAAGLGGALGCDGGAESGARGTAGSSATGGASATGGTSATGGASGSSGAPSNGGTPGAAGLGGSAGNARGGAPSANAGTGAGGEAGTPGSWPSVDEFEGTALDARWTIFRPDLADLTVADGALAITPKPKDLWYQASQGVLVYALMTGDFKVTATVHARKASDRSQTPAQFADVGGLMARNPSGDSENYVLGVVGYAEMNELAVEHKSTTNGQSDYGETAFTADAELRLCRTGSTFTIFYRHPGDSGWPLSVAPLQRADLPATLEVGMIAYTGASPPDYVSIFDRIEFEPVGAGCGE